MSSSIKTAPVSNWYLSKLQGQLLKFTYWIKLVYNMSNFRSGLNGKYLN